MATTTEPVGTATVQMIALREIRTDQNIRRRLIAGHKRHAALTQLGHTKIRTEIRHDETAEASERVAENIVRTQLEPLEEATAVRAMLDRGLTVDVVAEALGWSRARVTARTRLLELPDAAQEMVGDGRIALSAIQPLLAIGRVSSPLLDDRR